MRRALVASGAAGKSELAEAYATKTKTPVWMLALWAIHKRLPKKYYT
jgi:hypothetical protein